MKPILLAVLCLAAAPAGAQSLMPGPATAGRYEMQPIEGGIARLDTITGEVSLCRVEAGVLRCRPAEDSEDARPPNLADRNDEDRADRADRGSTLRDDTDAEVDKAIGSMKRFFRAFRDIAREFDEDRGGDRPDSEPPAPHRT